MISYVYNKMGIRIKHLWFEETPYSVNKKDCDIIFAHSLSTEYVSKSDYFLVKNQQYTLFSDLTNKEEYLFSAIKKNYRYEIRRCDRSDEEVTYCYYDQYNPIDQNLLAIFEKVYNQMYMDKGIKAVFNKNQVENMIKNECIVFTIGFYRGTPLVFHSYVYSQNDSKVRFYYSASPFRQEKREAERIGRINKGLHWFDFKTFRGQGIKLYDWGGIANPDNPSGIDQFKLSFGGKVGLLHNIMMGSSLKGKIIIILIKIKKKLKR